MKKTVWILLSLIAITVLGLVIVRQNRRITQLNEQLASAAQKPEARPLAPSVTEPPQSLPEAKPAEPVVPPVTAPSAQAGASAGVTSNYFSGLANMMKNPQMKEIVRAQQKVMLDRQYGSLSKYLNLPADRLDALKEILSDRQMAMVDAGMSMMSGSESEKKKAREGAMAIKSDYDKKIQELLGPQDNQVFQDYEKTLNERMSVQMFKESLSASESLSDQQEDNLIAMMYQERQAMPSPFTGKNEDPSQYTEERIAEMEKQMEQLQKQYAEKAAGILTPAQLEQFSKWQLQFNNMQLAGLKMAAAMFGNKGAASSTPSQQNKTP